MWFGVCKCSETGDPFISEPKYPDQQICRLIEGGLCEVKCVGAFNHQIARELAGEGFKPGWVIKMEVNHKPKFASDCFPASKFEKDLDKHQLVQKLMPKPEFKPSLRIMVPYVAAPADRLLTFPHSAPQRGPSVLDFINISKRIVTDPNAPNIAIAAAAVVVAAILAVKTGEAILTAPAGGVGALNPVSLGVGVAALGLIAQSAGLQTPMTDKDLKDLATAHHLSVSDYRNLSNGFSSTITKDGKVVQIEVDGKTARVSTEINGKSQNCTMTEADPTLRCEK
jgi:hypothetical protein